MPLFLIATEIKLVSDDAIKAHIAKQDATFHAAIVHDHTLMHPDGTVFELDALAPEKEHFIHIGAQPPETLPKLTQDGHFTGLIVGPEPVPADVHVAYLGRAGSGVNNLPIKEKEQLGHQFAAANSPGGNAPGTAFHTIRAVLELTECMPLTGHKITLMGAGHISRMVAIFLTMMGANHIMVWSRRELPEQEHIPGVTYTTDKQTALKDATILSLHIPLSPETEGFISNDELALLGDNAHILNFARPALVDPTALQEATNIKGIAIDGDYLQETGELSVLSPYMNLQAEKLLLLPHIGGDTVQQDRDAVINTHIDQALAYVRENMAHNLQSSPEALSKGIKPGNISQRIPAPAMLKNVMMQDLSPHDQTCVLQALLHTTNQCFKPLPEIHQAVHSNTLYTDSPEFPTLYGKDFRGESIAMRWPQTPENKDLAEKTLRDILTCMGANNHVLLPS